MVTLPVSFTGPYTEDEPNFPRQNNRILSTTPHMTFPTTKCSNFHQKVIPHHHSRLMTLLYTETENNDKL